MLVGSPRLVGAVHSSSSLLPITPGYGYLERNTYNIYKSYLPRVLSAYKTKPKVSHNTRGGTWYKINIQRLSVPFLRIEPLRAVHAPNSRVSRCADQYPHRRRDLDAAISLGFEKLRAKRTHERGDRQEKKGPLKAG